MKLIFFDLDGTLLPGTTAQLLDLECAFSAGQCTTLKFAHAIARLWSDVSVMTIAKAFSDAPKMSNIEPTLQFVRDLGWRSCLIDLLFKNLSLRALVRPAFRTWKVRLLTSLLLPHAAYCLPFTSERSPLFLSEVSVLL